MQSLSLGGLAGAMHVARRARRCQGVLGIPERLDVGVRPAITREIRPEKSLGYNGQPRK